MAIYTVTLRSTYFAQEIINRFSYVSVSTGAGDPSALELLELMGFIPDGDPPGYPADTLFDAIGSISNTGVSFREVEGRNLYSVSDFYLAPFVIPAAGQASGEGMSPFVSYGFFSDRVRTDIKRGTKRFTGVNEGAVDAGGVLPSGTRANLAVVAEAMTAVLEGEGNDYMPAVLSYEPYTAPSGRTAYRPYATASEQLDHAAYPVVWSYYETVRSQVSRQYGRGI